MCTPAGPVLELPQASIATATNLPSVK